MSVGLLYIWKCDLATSSNVSHLGMPWFLLHSTSLEYFFSSPLLHSQAKSRLKSGVGWAGKIYENWTAFQCFSPHVMLISSSKGSWLNFLFRNRRIFSIETFVIYKLGRLSALPLQQASRWWTSLQWVALFCDVFCISTAHRCEILYNSGEEKDSEMVKCPLCKMQYISLEEPTLWK